MIRAFFGGSFDPIHAGHLAIIDLLLERRLAAVVHVVPARQAPLRREAAVEPAAVRLELVKVALGEQPQVVVEDLEVNQGGPRYTVATLTRLVAAYPGDRWRLVLGADQAAMFDRWREPQRLLILADPVVVARGPVALAPPLVGRALVVADFAHPATATEIRRLLAAQRIPDPSLLPPAVARRIAAAGLYGFAARTPSAPKEAP